MLSSISCSACRKETFKHLIQANDGVFVVVHHLVNGVLQDQVVDLVRVVQVVLQLWILV